MATAQPLPACTRFGVPITGLIAVVIGGYWLAAWLAGAVAPRSAAGELTIKTNMALALLLAGAALLLLSGASRPRTTRRLAGAALAGVVLLIGVLTLSEHLLGWNLGIDELLAAEPPGATGTASPNRMGPPGSISLALLGAGLLWLAWERRRLVSYVGLAICVISLIPAVGFLYNISAFYGGQLTGIAWPTVIGLLSLGFGLILSRWRDGPVAILLRDDPGGALLRRLLPATLLLPLSLGFLTMYGQHARWGESALLTGLLVILLILTFSALLLSSAAHLSRSATREKRAREEHRQSEARYRTLFNSMYEGFAVHEIIVDEHGTPCDYRFVDVNAAFERLTGLFRTDVVGKRVLEVLPQTERSWIENFGRVALTGEPVHFEEFHSQLGRWYEVFSYRSAPGQFAVIFTDVTERKQAEEALRHSERRYRSFVEVTSQFGWVTDANGQVVEDVPALRKFTGQTLEQARGEGWSAALHPDDLRPTLETWNRAVVTRAPYEVEYRMRRHDGVYRLLLARGVPILDEDGSVVEWVGTCIDITERKMAEEALRESEERLRALAEALPEIVWTANAEGGIEWYNQRWYQYTGQPQGAGTGWSWDQFAYPDDMAHTITNWQKALQAGDLFENEIRLRRHDAQYRWFLVRAWPLRDGDGNVIRWFGTNTDVHDIKAAEGALRQSREDLGRAQAVGQIGSWRLDVGSDILTWSDEIYRIFGVPKGTPLSYDMFLGMIHPDDRRYVDAQWQAALSGEPYDLEHRIVVDGQIKWVREKAYLEFDESGRLLGGFGITQDITERRRAEEALRAAKSAAEEANAAKDRFLAVLSHELRTPLSPVLMTASAMEYDESLPAEVRQDMAMIRQSVELEVRLINDLLDFNRVKWSKLHLDLQPVDAHEKLQAAISVCGPEAQDKQISLSVELLATATQVNADGARLQQVFWNLLKNAIKFTPVKGSMQIRSTNAEEGTLQIQVTDSGMGIDAEALPYVFEPFVQASRHVARQFGGLGLGLAISKSLIEMHGGAIYVESSGPGKGATFTVELPTIPLSERKSAAPLRLGSAIAGLRVLLVEDHDITAEVLAKLLTRLGHDVRVTRSVAEGLQTLASAEFDLLISDLGLPDGSGHDLMRQVRKLKPQLAALAMSGYGMDSDVQKSREVGFNEHLTKPVDLQTLQAAILRVVDRPDRP